MTRVRYLVIATVLIALLASVAPGLASPEDWSLSGGGHFFTQTGGGGGKGYSVTNEGDVQFWTEFNRLGGVQAVGYPVTQRFQWNGFTCQGFQRVIFQWRPETQSVAFVNVFDLLHDAGKDDWLQAARQTPKPFGPEFDSGLQWSQVVEKRLGVLDTNAAIKAQYYAAVGDPVQMNGLPTSEITDTGDNYTLRCQRIVIQQWKKEVPWAKAGQVTVALGGDISKEAGIIPNAAALAPIDAPTGVASPTSVPVPASTGQILLTSNRDSWDDLWVTNNDGSGARKITADGKNYGAQWSPDGARMTFSHIQNDGKGERPVVVVMNSDGTGRRVLTQGSMDIEMDSSWSPDGSRILFLGAYPPTWQWRLYTTAPDGSDRREIPVPGVTNDTILGGPKYSPDGNKIAFYGDIKTGGSSAIGIFILDLNTGSVRRLTSNNYYNVEPIWSPDGSQIVFNSLKWTPAPGAQRPNEAWRIWIVGADGSGLRPLIVGSGGSEEHSQNIVAWRGSELLIASWEGHWIPKIANADGTNIRTITMSSNDDKPSDWR